MKKIYKTMIPAAVITIASTGIAYPVQDIAIEKFTLAQPGMPSIGTCNAIQQTKFFWHAK